MTTEFKTFIEDKDGFITHVTVNGDDANDVWANFQMVMSWFREDGAKPNKGFENKVVRSGGGQKQEAPVPAELADKVPSHCGQPMIYKPAYKSTAGKDVGAKFQCRAGEACQQPDQFNGKRYGHSMWVDRYLKDLEAEYA